MLSLCILVNCGTMGAPHPTATTSPTVAPSTAVTLTPSATPSPTVTPIPIVSPEPAAAPEPSLSMYPAPGEPKDVTYEIDANVNDGMPMYRFIASGVTDADLYHVNSTDWYMYGMRSADQYLGGVAGS